MPICSFLHLQLKASADQMEEREYKAAAAAQLNRQNMEYSKLQSRQMRDAEALQRKLQVCVCVYCHCHERLRVRDAIQF